MHWIDEAPGRFVHLHGQAYRYFSGTAYLGMAHNKHFRELLREGIVRYGPNFGGSRLGNIRFTVFGEAEDWLANRIGAEAALLVSSGTLAGQFVAKYLKTHSSLYFAPMAHPALWETGHYFEGSFDAWVGFILEEVGKGEKPMALFSNSVDALFARKFRFGWLEELPAHRAITLVVDDSHGLGICGEKGRSAWAEIKLPEQVELVVVSSLGKAMGISGGAILGSKKMMEAIWHTPFFGGASPAAPAHLYAMMHAGSLYDAALAKLRGNVRRLAKQTAGLGLFHSFEDYPVFYTAEPSLAPWLEARKCLASQFSYPTSEDEPVTRVVLSALHEKEDIDYLADAIRSFAKEKNL